MNSAMVATSKKVLTWMAVAAVVLLAMVLPVVVVTGMFGGQPWAGTLPLLGMILLAFGVAWYVRNHTIRG